MPKELTLRQNMLWNSAGSLFYLGTQWLITIVVVRLSTGYDAAGVLTLAMSVYGIFSPIAEYRMYIYQVSDVRKENELGEYVAFRAVTCGISLVLCVAYSLVTCAFDVVLPIFLYGVYKCASSMIDVLHAQDQIEKRMDYIGKSLSLQGISSLALFVVVFYFTGNLNLTFLVMTAGVVLVGLLFDIPHTRQFGKIGFGISNKKVVHLIVLCAPVVIGFVACSTAPSIPRQYLFEMSGEAALGIYGSVSAPVAIIQAGASYIYNPLIGYFADSYGKRDSKTFNSFLIKATLCILAFGVMCLVLLIILGGPFLVFVFGPSISDYVYLLPLIALSSIGIAYMGFMNGLMLAIRDFKAGLVGGIAALVVSLCSTFFFVNTFDMNGVSLVLLVSSLAAAVVMFAFLLVRLRELRKERDDGGSSLDD